MLSLFILKTFCWLKIYLDPAFVLHENPFHGLTGPCPLLVEDIDRSLIPDMHISPHSS
jgi:hypothetical protein